MGVLYLVAEQNRARHRSARYWSVSVYCLIGVALLCQATMLSLLCGYCLPVAWLRSLPRAGSIRAVTLYWLYPSMLLAFLITAGAGVIGWMVITALYQVVIFVLAIYAVCKGRRVTGGTKATTSSDKRLSAAEQAVVIERFLATPRPPDVNRLYRERLAVFYAKHNPDKMHLVDDMLLTYRGVEEALVLDLRKKYRLPMDEEDAMFAAAAAAVSGRDGVNRSERGAASLSPSMIAQRSGSIAPGAAPSYASEQFTALLAPKVPWSQQPTPMSPAQQRSLGVASAGFFLSLALMLAVIYTWEVKAYQVLNRSPSPMSVAPTSMVEFQPSTTAKTLQLMYSWPGLATDMRMAIYVKLLTQQCGKQYSSFVPSSERQSVIDRDWIQVYGVNMTQFAPASYAEYATINDWFIRELRPGARPIEAPSDEGVVIAPADGRYTVFPSVTAATQLWIKGGWFNYTTLLDQEPLYRLDAAVGGVVGGNSKGTGADALFDATSAVDYFAGGSVIIARLAPQDYHRFHVPLGGRVTAIRRVEGSFWSVGADAVRSWNSVFYNTRMIIVIEAPSVIRRVGATITALPKRRYAVVAIGATCVGSVVLVTHGNAATVTPPGAVNATSNGKVPVKVGMTLAKGDELGYMQFGGSTLITLFRRGEFEPDCDLLIHSALALETFLPMGRRVGQRSISDDVRCV